MSFGSSEEQQQQQAVVSSVTATTNSTSEIEEDDLFEQLVNQSREQDLASLSNEPVASISQSLEEQSAQSSAPQYTQQQLDLAAHYANVEMPEYDGGDDFGDLIALLTDGTLMAKQDILESLVGNEIQHSPGGDLDGDELGNILVGGNTNDTLNGHGGSDWLIGGLGNLDVLRGGNENDILIADKHLSSDYNGDDVVNGADLAIWQANYGQSGVQIIYLDGDFNKSGQVDGADFLAWMRNTSIGNLSDWQANYGQSGTEKLITYIPGDGDFDGYVDGMNFLTWQRQFGDTVADVNNDVPSTAGDRLYGGSGDDILYAGMGFDHLWGGSGADTFVATEIQFFLSGATFVRDFNSADGDVLDISNIVSGYDPMEDMLSDFISLQDRAGTQNVSDLYINSDGTGGSLGFATVEITGMSGYGSGASEAQLQALVDNGIFVV